MTKLIKSTVRVKNKWEFRMKILGKKRRVTIEWNSNLRALNMEWEVFPKEVEEGFSAQTTLAIHAQICNDPVVIKTIRPF